MIVNGGVCRGGTEEAPTRVARTRNPPSGGSEPKPVFRREWGGRPQTDDRWDRYEAAIIAGGAAGPGAAMVLRRAPEGLGHCGSAVGGSREELMTRFHVGRVLWRS